MTEQQRHLLALRDDWMHKQVIASEAMQKFQEAVLLLGASKWEVQILTAAETPKQEEPKDVPHVPD